MTAIDLLCQGRLQAGIGLLPAEVLHGHVWRLLTFGLLHAHIPQLLGNALVLWIIARKVEERWGTAKFFGFWVCGTIGTAVVALLVAPTIDKPYLGASGPTLALLLPYAAIFGKRRTLAGLRATQVAGVLAAVSGVAAWQVGLPVAASASCFGGVLAAAAWLATEPRVLRMAATSRRRRRIRAQQELVELRSRVDALLDKIHVGGMRSLTRRERAFLDDASRVYAEQVGDETRSGG